MKNRGLIKYLGIILVGCILLSCGMRVWAEEREKEAEKVEIEVRQDEYGTTKKKYLVTKEEGDRIWGMQRVLAKTFDAIEKAYRDKEIDLDTELIYKVWALKEPELVPEEYKPESVTIGYVWATRDETRIISRSEYSKEKPDLKYHQDFLKKLLRELHKDWLNTKKETHSKLWSSEIFPYLEEYIRENAERERVMFGYEFLYIPPDDAYIIKEIDLDQMMLYRYGPPEERPARFIPPKPTRIPEWIHPFFGDKRPSPWEQMLPLVRYSRYLRPETREKIKLYRWKDLAERRKNQLGIGIDSPEEAVGGFSWGIGYPEKEKQGGAKVYTPTIKIKGKIVTPEMFGEVEAWAALRGDGRLSFPVDESGQVKEIRKEIILGPPTYEKPLFDEKAFKEDFEKWTEVEVDEFAMDYERGPGRIIRAFEIELELPYYIGNIITIGAQNNGGESTSIELYVTRYDSTDKEPPKVKIKRPKGGAVLGTHDTYEGKGEELAVFCEATDDKEVLWVEVYADGQLVGIDFEANRKARGDDYYRLGIPAKIGKNKIKVVAYDIGNNTKSDTIEVIYSPEKR